MLTLQSHNTLLEFLEIPQMMDTCIKNQCFEEALELRQFSKKLFREHKDIPAISLIVRIERRPLTSFFFLVGRSTRVLES